MKKIIALLLFLTMMLGLSVPAFATANETSGSMAVTYNIESSYLVNLPDVTLTGESTTVEITADYVHIAPGHFLTVAIDAERTLTDGVFYLFKDGSTDVSTAIECSIYVETVSNSANADFYTPHYVSATSDNRLVRFKPEDLVPEAFGKITFTPNVTINNTYGTYTGNIYYIITVE